MKFIFITTFIVAVVLSIFLFVPPLARAVEDFYASGGEITLEMQFLRLGVLTGLYFVIVTAFIKLREKLYD